MKPRCKKTLWTALAVMSMVGMTAALAHAEGAGGGEEGASLKDWLWHLVNFGIFAAALIYLLAKPFKRFLVKRSDDIRQALDEARAAREEALGRLADVQARLRDKDKEIQSLLDMAQENGKKEKELLVKEGDRVAADILSSARENIDAELFKARESLRREAALLAMELAEKMVKENISKEDQARILEDYIARVGTGRG